MELNEMEKNFLIDCIITAALEGFYYNTIPISDEEIRDLLVRLGASEEELDKYNQA